MFNVVRQYILTILLSAISFVLVFVTVDVTLKPDMWTIKGPSMFPTLMDGDTVLSIGNNFDVERGDIVVLTGHDDQVIVKRIVGIPGDCIQIIEGQILVNNETEAYRLRLQYINGVHENAVWNLNDNEYFVVGDNRLNSFDSRTYGPVIREQILAQVILRFRGVIVK